MTTTNPRTRRRMVFELRILTKATMRSYRRLALGGQILVRQPDILLGYDAQTGFGT